MGNSIRGFEFYEFVNRKIVDSIIVHFGEDKEAPAKAVAMALCEELVSEWGGSQVYLPKAALAKYAALADLIWSEFNGSNYGALARKHGRSEMRIRQIVNAMRIKSKQQGGL